MRRALAVLICLMMIPAIPLASDSASGGKVSVAQFRDGSATRTCVFEAAGANSSAQLELPKTATIVNASVDITGRPYLQNISISADTKMDFASSALANMDINSSAGDIRLLDDPSWNDEFNGSSLDPKWSWYNTPAAYDMGVNRSGHLRIVSPRNVNFNQNSDNGILAYQTISGGFYAETAIVSNPQNDWQKSGIMVRQDANNWALLKYQAQSGQKIQWTRKVGGAASDTQIALSASTVYLGLERDGNSFSVRYSTDGGNWTSVAGGPWTIQLADPVRVGLIVADGGSNTDYAADFDYFRLHKYVGNGSLQSGWTQAPGNVSQARATCSGTINPQNTSFQLSVRTGPQNPWQTLMPGVTTQLSTPGDNISYKIEMTSDGLRTPDLGLLKIDLSIPHLPSDISLGLGSGAPFWNHSGELNATRTIDLKNALAAFLAGATPGPGGNVTVPLALFSGSAGVLILQNLTVVYLIGVAPAAPSLVSPATGTFLSSSPPTLIISAGDADGDPLLFSVDLSTDGFSTKTSYDQTISGAGWSKGNRTYNPGEDASLRPSMSFVDGRAYSWRARAFDGAYWGPYSEVRSFTIDTSPPVGAPRDEGNITSAPDSLSATLDFRDNESGVDSYEYRIGTSPGAWDVTANTTTPNSTVVVNGMTLSMGTTYYFTARARNRARLWSGCHTSDGIMYWPSGVPTEMIRIDQPSAGVNLSGVVTVSGISWRRAGWTLNTTVQVRIEDGPWKTATFIGAPPAYARNWTLKWDTTQISDGNYTIRARIVFGNGSEAATADVTIRVSNTIPPPPIPVLEADFFPDDNATISIPENSSFEFSLQTDVQDPVISWAVDGLKRPVEKYPAFVFYAGYTSAGVHVISVIIKWENLSLQHNWNLTVTDVDQPPVAAILAPSPNSILKKGTVVTFNASSSMDPDPDDRLNFSWVLGDGFSLNGSEVVHIYMEPGQYQVILTVSDGSLESRAYLNLTVTAPETVQTGGGPSSPFVLMIALIVVAAALSGGGYMYWSRRRAAELERQRKMALEQELAASRPADATEGPGGAPSSRTSEISAEEVMQASEKAAADASSNSARTAGQVSRTPDPKSIYSRAPEAGPELQSFDEIPEAEAIPEAEVMAVEPVPVAPAARPAIPKAPARPATPATPARPATSPAPARPATHAPPSQPAKKPETLEDILAALKDH